MLHRLALIAALASPGCFETPPPREQQCPQQEIKSPSETAPKKNTRQGIRDILKATKPDPEAPPPPLRKGEMFT